MEGNPGTWRRKERGVIVLTLHANFTPFIDQLDNTFFLTFFPLHQDFHEHHEIPEDYIQHVDIQQMPTTNLRSGARTTTIYESIIVPVQPLICPVIHYGNPRFQIPQQYCQRPLRPNCRIGQDSADGNTCKYNLDGNPPGQ